MELIILLLLILAVGSVSILFDRRWQARKQVQAADVDSRTTEAVLTETKDASPPGIGKWLGWLPNGRKTELPEHFRAWYSRAFSNEPTVKQWLDLLSAEGMQAFTHHLDQFCSDMGFDLRWLLEERLETNPELQQMTRQIVLHYCLACQTAALAQDTIDVQKLWFAFAANPTSRKNQEFGGILLDKLSKAGMTSASVSDYLTAAAQNQPQQMVQYVVQGAENDPTQFQYLLRQTVIEMHAPQAAQGGPTDGDTSSAAGDSRVTGS